MQTGCINDTLSDVCKSDGIGTEVFLRESLDNNNNGCYSRFINHLQCRFEIGYHGICVVRFYLLTLKIKQDSARMDQLALSSENKKR